MKKLLTILFVLIAFVASAQSTFNRWFPTSGTDTYSTNITSYSTLSNTVIYIKFGNTNTGASTLTINTTLGPAAIRYWDGNSWEPLPASHIDVNTVYKLSYNGSYFEMESFGTGTGSGSGTTMNNLPVEYKVTNYSLVPGDTSKMLVLQSPLNTLTLGSFASGVDGSQFVIYNETGATVTIDPDTYITKGPLEILDTTYAYIHFNADTFRISTASRDIKSLQTVTTSTAGSTITLDMDGYEQVLHIGSASFATTKTIAMSNTTNAKVFAFKFEITDLAAVITVPSNWYLDSENYSGGDWTATALGRYTFSGIYDGTNWMVNINSNPYVH